MRPILNRDTPFETFKEYYWLKEELQTFCRHYGISASGSKIEISERVSFFLSTGEIIKPVRKSKQSAAPQETLSLDTVITEHHRCSQEVRAFFKSVIPTFHFSTYIQNYFKLNAGKTYRDAVEEWHHEEKRKKEPAYKKEIAPQFEYNQFTRDFFADPKNQGKKRADAIAAWNEIKKLPGSNKYVVDN
ncbi:SAP domain-containing protein [Rossellomorea sp. SC111]|uniref:SAP domain-containing protein n=1 Tax=Rossellomorea sp. SC111 TaxID=2968985 RepID=UPI00215A4D90|nr:SAP domain-containing protein [Rossellomorea sp. SC111]MCR8849364.1 SAP domain-containing protein [Rossellomorea sp. SC111]